MYKFRDDAVEIKNISIIDRFSSVKEFKSKNAYQKQDYYLKEWKRECEKNYQNFAK